MIAVAPVAASDSDERIELVCSSGQRTTHSLARVLRLNDGWCVEEGRVIPLEPKAGDKILFGKWPGSEVKLDGEDLLIMKESDVLGVLA